MPGTTTSGLWRLFLTGPRLLKSATASGFGSMGFRELRLAPTVMQFLAAASALICSSSNARRTGS